MAVIILIFNLLILLRQSVLSDVSEQDMSERKKKEDVLPVLPQPEATESVFGTIDLMILAVVFGAATYWLYRRKKDDSPNTNLITIVPTEVVDMDTSFVKKMKETGRNVIIFYGTQTGTAEECAVRLANEAKRYGLRAMLADPEEYDMEDLCNLPQIENSMALFTLATYGEGDPTDNAIDLHKTLKEGNFSLYGLRYAVFGLGNKTYEHFNAMAKFCDKRLEELGATRIFEVGLGDDDGSLEEDFVQWKENFYNRVQEMFHLEPVGDDVIFRQYREIIHAEDEIPQKIFTGEIARLNAYRNQRPPFDMKNPYLAPMTVKRELNKGDRSCMHIELDISGARLRYEAGDHVAIYPTNDDKLVERLAELLNVENLDTVFTLQNVDEDSTKQHPFPCPTTYRTALRHYVDITATPRTHVLKEIAEFATNEEEKALLKKVASSSEEGRSLYHSWVLDNCRSIIHILEDLPSVRPPLDLLFELLPRLQARYYSISSSPKMTPSSVHVTAVLVKYETPTHRINTGVTTGWLSRLTANPEVHQVPIFIRKSQFRPPSKASTPIIMIGPGTGLAPFRGFIQDRLVLKGQGIPVGQTILYFGCRKASEDFLYEEELKEHLSEGVLTKLYLAFSRDQPEKVYVTHLLTKNKEETWDIIGKQNGHIYVCGDARNMAKDVHAIILDTVKEYGKMSEYDAETFIKKMESQRRYCVDVWG